MKRGSTIFLRGAVIIIGLIVLGLCVFALPAGITSSQLVAYRPMFLGLYVTAVPFFIALYHALELLDFIDRDQTFSDASVHALRYIRNCAVVIAALFAAGSPYVYMVANHDDGPGVLAIALVVIFASLVIAVFAAVLQKVLQSAIAIKSENDLTV